MNANNNTTTSTTQTTRTALIWEIAEKAMQKEPKSATRIKRAAEILVAGEIERIEDDNKGRKQYRVKAKTSHANPFNTHYIVHIGVRVSENYCEHPEARQPPGWGRLYEECPDTRFNHPHMGFCKHKIAAILFERLQRAEQEATETAKEASETIKTASPKPRPSFRYQREATPPAYAHATQASDATPKVYASFRGRMIPATMEENTGKYGDGSAVDESDQGFYEMYYQLHKRPPANAEMLISWIWK